MLDRLALTGQVLTITQPFFARRGQQLHLARQVWHEMVTDLDLHAQVLHHKFALGLPIWQSGLIVDQVVSFSQLLLDYTVVACDGSQIYPDRHTGTNCYLINIGQSILRYSNQLNQMSSCAFSTKPYFFTDLNGTTPMAELVDCHRHSLEMQVGWQVALAEKTSAKKLISLIDGSLIAWHLDGKNSQLQEQFLLEYIQQLLRFEQACVPYAGYISLPNSRELINLLLAYKANFVANMINKSELELLTDADLLWEVLEPGQYVGWFISGVAAAQAYPESVRPYFVYLHTGHEIARLEFPAWVVAQSEIFELSLQMIFDQVFKGVGYPVGLAEAHLQAVVKSDDKLFFYNLLRQVGQQQGHSMVASRKSVQKKIINI